MLGLLANAVLFFAMFRLLAAPDVPQRAMWSGALLGAVGFEILKQVSTLLIRSTQGKPAFQVFGLALILLVWINYFSRVILYAASWAWTHPLAREQRVVEPAAPVEGPRSPSVDEPHEVAGPGRSVQEGRLRRRRRLRGGRRDGGRPRRPGSVELRGTSKPVGARLLRQEREQPGTGRLLAPTCPR